jgi:hypothetical protein
MDSSKIEASKILVWGHIGQDLKDLDPERVLAVAQKDPRYFLSLIANGEIAGFIDYVFEHGLTKDLEKFIEASNKKQAIFIEVAEFLQDSGDMLSTGSFLTGELESEKAILRLMED